MNCFCAICRLGFGCGIRRANFRQPMYSTPCNGRHRGYVLAILRRLSMPIWPNTPMYSIADAASRACNTKQSASLGPKNAVNRHCPPLKCRGMAISLKIPTMLRYAASSNAENEQNSRPSATSCAKRIWLSSKLIKFRSPLTPIGAKRPNRLQNTKHSASPIMPRPSI